MSAVSDQRRLQLRNARLVPGTATFELADVAVVGDRITAVRPAGELAQTLDRDRTHLADRDVTGVEVIDLDGDLLLPAFVEPHAHLDKALTAHRVPNPTGDLMGAIEAWVAHRRTITRQDFIERATRAAELLIASGCNAIRTHVDLGADIGTTGLEALLEVRSALEDQVRIQLVGLAHGLTGPYAKDQIAVVDHALKLGLDVVGGVPHLETDPAAAIDIVLEMAGEHSRPIDLHTDENLEPGSSDLLTLADRVLATGFEYGVTASHGVALTMAGVDQQRLVARRLAQAKISVITLPITNLYLQGRDHPVAMPRALTPLGPLLEAGVNVAAGADNLRDPFNPMGRADPLETAMLTVVAGHRSASEALHMITTGARNAMGLEPVVIEPGGRAELIVVNVKSLYDALAGVPTRWRVG